MRRSLRLSSLFALLALLALAVAPLAAGEGETYGKGITAPSVIKLSALLEKPELFVGKVVRIEGLVTDVCPKRGCWMKVAGDKEFQEIKIKVEDGVIVFPLSAKGKRADVEGILRKIELTKDEAIARAKHEAEEKKVPFDPKSVTGPMVIYQIEGTGAVIR